MTNTTTEATEIFLGQGSDEYEAAMAELEAAVSQAQRGERRYSRRDRLGRFVKAHRIDEMQAVGVFVNASDGTTHSHTRCGNLKGQTFEFGTHAEGFLCPACVEVPAPAWLVARDLAPVVGHRHCDTCNTERRMRSFPTFVDGGFRQRGTTCRKCEAAHRAA